MRVVLVAGSTETARIEGISAAGADPSLMAHTPSADLEIVEYGRPVGSSVVPVSPSGCPTPAVITRAARELLGFETLAIDAGLARATRAPTVRLGERGRKDVREARALPGAEAVFEAGRELGHALPDEELLIGETIPGGTTTAMATLDALGERADVSSSLPANPRALKRRVVGVALEASDLAPGGAAGDPLRALRCVGDPVLAAAAGLVCGASETGTSLTLAGGTQLAAVGALARHAGVETPLSLSTTSFLAGDESADIRGMAADLDLDLAISDPGFDRQSHPAMAAYTAGEAKEGVGTGGVLRLVDRSDVSMAALRERVLTVYDRLSADERTVRA